MGKLSLSRTRNFLYAETYPVLSTFPVSFLIASAIRLGPKPRLIMSSSMYRAVSSSVRLQGPKMVQKNLFGEICPKKSHSHFGLPAALVLFLGGPVVPVLPVEGAQPVSLPASVVREGQREGAVEGVVGLLKMGENEISVVCKQVNSQGSTMNKDRLLFNGLRQ